MNPLRSDKDSTQYQNCKISGRITGIMSIQYFALNVNSGLVYAVGEILAVTADCFLKENVGITFSKLQIQIITV